MTHREFHSARGLSPRKYHCRGDMCSHVTYVWWYDINDMTFKIPCQACKHDAGYVAGRLRPIPVNGINQKGYYDKALGRYIESHAHKDKVMQELGVRPVSNEEIETNMHEQINDAIEAGASMSTHLGNASHAMLPRHSNYVMEQLASDELWSSLIADGFHLPDSLLKIFIKTKPNKSILVSDATSYADLLPGTYKAHIGGDVELDSNGRLFMKNSPKMLAGSAQSLLWCVNQLIKKNILSLHEAWNMASIKPTECLFGNSTNYLQIEHPADLVIFKKEGDSLKIIKTIKSGKLVFSNSENN